MTATVVDHPLQWVTAGPLWPDAAGTGTAQPTTAQRDAMLRPALLRFTSDAFMEDLASLLDEAPERLAEHRADPVTFRPPVPGDAAPAVPQRLKLFGAVHGHFQLVAASLVCRRVGLPEHRVSPERRERAGFVLRRLAAQAEELAWVTDPEAPQGGRWVEVPQGEVGALAQGERLLPMFTLPYAAPDRARRLLVGLLPTASTEMSRNAGPGTLSGTGDELAGFDARAWALAAEVVEPLASLQRRAGVPDTAGETEAHEILDATAAEKVAASRFLLLDLAARLAGDQPEVWAAVVDGRRGASTLAQRLIDTPLHDEAVAPDLATGRTWAQALVLAWEQRADILGESGQGPSFDENLERSQPAAQTLGEWLTADLPEPPASPAATGPPPAAGPESATVPKLAPRAGVLYHVRCVYQRPDCGPLHADVVSAPSEPFEIAGFFDVDAPARPLTIGLPVDTSIQDLRKFKRNVALVLSDQLRTQMSRATDMAELMKGNIASGKAFDAGLVCSLSIPIITICALILLMIMVQLLNLIFWWLPFFRICFPVGVRSG